MITDTKQIAENWIKLTDGKFICPECENESRPLVTTIEGTVEADLDAIKKELEEFPTKVIYAVCPVCGMEYVLHLVDSELYMEPSEEEK